MELFTNAECKIGELELNNKVIKPIMAKPRLYSEVDGDNDDDNDGDDVDGDDVDGDVSMVVKDEVAGDNDGVVDDFDT